MMDADLLMIFSFVIVVTTIIGVTINGVVQKVLDYKRSKYGLRTENAAATSQVGAVSDRTDLIEDRLAVLERIATDRGQLLADEIEQLRGSAINTRQTESSPQ